MKRTLANRLASETFPTMRVVQLSDPHVASPPERLLFGENALLCLQNAVRAVNSLQPLPDFAVITGDLVNDQQESSYRLVKTALDRLQIPFHLAVGNHDARKPFRRVMWGEKHPSGRRICYAFEHCGYVFIVLDSLEEGQVKGRIDDGQLEWLDQVLGESPSSDITVLLHHPPVRVNVKWMDALRLQEGARLRAILEHYPQVRRVLCGHLHHAFQLQIEGITYLTTPSVSFQLRKRPLAGTSDDPMRLHRKAAPSFRVVDFDGDNWGTFLQRIHPE